MELCLWGATWHRLDGKDMAWHGKGALYLGRRRLRSWFTCFAYFVRFACFAGLDNANKMRLAKLII